MGLRSGIQVSRRRRTAGASKGTPAPWSQRLGLEGRAAANPADRAMPFSASPRSSMSSDSSSTRAWPSPMLWWKRTMIALASVSKSSSSWICQSGWAGSRFRLASWPR